MKLIKQEIPEGEYNGILNQIWAALKEHKVKMDVQFGSELVALDGDFIPTTNINDARWLMADSYYAMILIRINNDGSMTHLKSE